MPRKPLPQRPVRPARLRFVPWLEVLEDRAVPAGPSAPVIIEPLTDGQIVSNFDVHMEINPNTYSDPDGSPWQATNWLICEVNTGPVVWQALNVTDPLSKQHIHFADGTFVGSLSGQTALLFSHDYELHVTFIDSTSEVGTLAIRRFRTASATEPVPGEGTWIVRAGYRLEDGVAAADQGTFRLPVNIAFVPNPGPNPTDPLYYVTELYGHIKVVRRNGTVGLYTGNAPADPVTGLLNYNPATFGGFPGAGEQGLTGIAVDPNNGDLIVSMLYFQANHPVTGNPVNAAFPRVERLHSNDGGQTIASRTVLLDVGALSNYTDFQGQSHQVSNVTFGPDGLIYVHNGDGFSSVSALNNSSFRGKILRMNPDGSPVTTNPFYNGGALDAPDYIWTKGQRNPFGGAWRAANGRHYVVENGNGIDRFYDIRPGETDYGWANNNDATLLPDARYVWNPATAPVNVTFVQPSTLGGSLYPAGAQDHAFVSLSGPTYAGGPQDRGKRIEEFGTLDTLFDHDSNPATVNRLQNPPSVLVNYNGTGQSTIVAIAAGPDGIYFSTLYEDTGAGGPVAPGANIFRVRYVGFLPTNLTATPGNRVIKLNWTANPMAVSYDIYRGTASGGETLLQSGVTGTQFLDTGLTPGTTYYYVVRGRNAGGDSDDSNEASAAPGTRTIRGTLLSRAARPIPRAVRTWSPAPPAGPVLLLAAAGGDLASSLPSATEDETAAPQARWVKKALAFWSDPDHARVDEGMDFRLAFVQKRLERLTGDLDEFFADVFRSV